MIEDSDGIPLINNENMSSLNRKSWDFFAIVKLSIFLILTPQIGQHSFSFLVVEQKVCRLSSKDRKSKFAANFGAQKRFKRFWKKQ